MPHRSRKFTWLLLALLALRGLVPAGYMIDTTGGSLSLVVCSSGVYSAAAQADHSKHAEHHHHHQNSHQNEESNKESAASDHSICPFALAATGAPTPVLPAIDVAASTEIGRIVDNGSSLFGTFGPSRAQQSRAPPSFS